MDKQKVETLVELSIIFSLLRYSDKLYNKISFLTKEDFIYFGGAYEIVTSFLKETEAFKLLKLRDILPADYLENFEDYIADEDDLDTIVRYAELLREKNILSKAEKQIKILSGKKFTSTQELYEQIKSIQDTIIFGKPVADEIYDISKMMDVFEKEFTSEKIRFGFNFSGQNIDKYIYDFVPGNVVVIGARPNIGKTLLALHISRSNAQLGVPTHFISLEMKPYQIFVRLLSMVSGVSAAKIFKNALNEEEEILVKEAQEYLKQQRMPLYFTSTFDGQLSSIENLMRKSVYENGTKIFVIDYIQLMSNPSYAHTRHLEIASIAQRMKNLAIELDVAIVEISQLSRKLNNISDPQMSDLKESGDIEQAASIVALLGDKGEEIVEEITIGDEIHPVVKKKILFKVDKQRNGPKFSAIVSFDTISFFPVVEEVIFGKPEKK